MQKYAAYKTFSKFNGKVYQPGSEFEYKDGKIFSEDGFMCLASSEKSKECLVGNDDGEWEKRGELIGEIRELIKLDGTKDIDVMLRRYDFLFSDKTVYQYGQNHDPDNDAWIWNEAFFAAPIPDLEFIKQTLEVIK